jgi:translation initiation factor IF-2
MDVSKRPRRRHRHEDGSPIDVAEDNVLQVPEYITVGELAEKMENRPQELIAACLRMGLLANINQRLDKDTITLLADEFGYGVDFLPEYGVGVDEAEPEEEIAPEKLRPRAPVVTIMGHVDHGKTSLLDRVRRSKLTETEAGGMTQHIGAYQVRTEARDITFLDTPGHEAFTAMRARGAQVTDIVILVVAADDGVMPQTIEAINHARAAGVPIIVAINKTDLPSANPDRVKKELADHGVLVEEYGGKAVAVPISAKQGIGVERLLEMILLVSEMEDLKADPERRARGVIVEARMEQGRGPVGTVLVQQGTLRVGDAFVCGLSSGKIRALFNDHGARIESAGPSTPVEVLGFSGPPQAGDTFQSVATETMARETASKRQQLHREHEFRLFRHITLADVYQRIQQGETSELRIVLKGDVQGSVEVLTDQMGKLGTQEVQVKIIHAAVGQINESDVLLAAASDAVIVGFHTRPDPKAQILAVREKVDIRLYDIIYEAIQEVRDALSGLLKPERIEKVTGTVEVRQVFRTSSGTIAGCHVTSGTVTRQSRIRVVREGQPPVFDGRVASLKRFKDDVREVQSGFECGIALEGFEDFQEKDVLEAYTVEEVARKL